MSGIDLGLYEVLDRVNVIFDTFERNVLTNQSVIENETIKANAERAEKELADLYQLVARECLTKDDEGKSSNIFRFVDSILGEKI